MIKNYKYTDKEKKQIIDSMVILIDTREKANEHIVDFFEKKKIPYKKKALDKGDYSFYIAKNSELGIIKDVYFDSEIVIERKASLEELSGNLTQNRDRFEHELSLAPKNKVLLLENCNFDDIVDGNYDTKYNKKSFLASMFTFWHRYNLPVFFMPDIQYTPAFIKLYFTYYLKSKILH